MQSWPIQLWRPVYSHGALPVEPKDNGPGFDTPLQGCPNTILTPHIGGSTEEAQAAIGVEVARKVITYINGGSSLGSVNFPEVYIVMTYVAMAQSTSPRSIYLWPM